MATLGPGDSKAQESVSTIASNEAGCGEQSLLTWRLGPLGPVRMGHFGKKGRHVGLAVAIARLSHR